MLGCFHSCLFLDSVKLGNTVRKNIWSSLKDFSFGSSLLLLLPHKQQVTSLISGGGTHNLLLMVTGLSSKSFIEMPPALKNKKRWRRAVKTVATHGKVTHIDPTNWQDCLCRNQQDTNRYQTYSVVTWDGQTYLKDIKCF